MQGQRNSATALPENLSFDHGSMSSDTGIASQVLWASMQTSAENELPDYRISSETNSQYLHHVGHEGLTGEFNLGESSSIAAQSQADHSKRKREHTWNIHSRAALNLEERQQSSNIPSLDNVHVNEHGNLTANGSSIPQISSPDSLPQDLNMCSEFRDSDDCQVDEPPNTHISVRSSNEKMPSTGSSSGAFGVPSGSGEYMEDNDYRPGCSLDGQRISCKRKALEVHIGQSSGAGSSNCFDRAEKSQWHAVPAAQNSASNVSLSMRPGHNLIFSNGSEQANSWIRLGAEGAASANIFSSSARGAAESSHRNFHLHINSSHQQDHVSVIPFSTEAEVENSIVSSSRHSSRQVLRNRLFGFSPTAVVENGSHHSQSVLSHVPPVRGNPQSRWLEASSSRISNSSVSSISVERERGNMLYEESASGTISRNISEHSMFVPANEMGSSSQQPRNWILAGGSNNIAGNVASASQAGSASGVISSSHTWSRRSYPQYPRRLSEIVRRSLVSSVGTDSGVQSRNHGVQSSSSVTSQEMALSSVFGNHDHHISNSRSALLERHVDGALEVPHSLRRLATAGEGRNSIMSEIRHVLDLMRRGEGLRFEDMMILDNSVFSGMADIHDRHRHMRMDVDNMSYEELLALEERIGNVCTGLNEETIMSCLKQQKYAARRAADEAEIEPCSICREEYNNGEDLGVLDCGHDFHGDCIKQWLKHKNLCPICKTTGLTT